MATQDGDWGGLLARARSGDEAAFLGLWRGLQPPLLRYLRVFGCDDPDDVASETWFQVLRDLHKFSGDDGDFRRWLFTVARHRAIDAARARARRRVSTLADGLDGLADGQTVEDQVLDGMSVRQAITMLAGLSQDQAEAVALRIIADLDTAAVASILGKSPGAVRVALHRGLRVLAADPRVQALASGAGADPGPAGPDPGPALAGPDPNLAPPPRPSPAAPVADPGLLFLGEVGLSER
jgi:RNA polymerase sigma-70 factor (ECF subfamily)